MAADCNELRRRFCDTVMVEDKTVFNGNRCISGSMQWRTFARHVGVCVNAS